MVDYLAQPWQKGRSLVLSQHDVTCFAQVSGMPALDGGGVEGERNGWEVGSCNKWNIYLCYLNKMKFLKKSKKSKIKKNYSDFNLKATGKFMLKFKVNVLFDLKTNIYKEKEEYKYIYPHMY